MAINTQSKSRSRRNPNIFTNLWTPKHHTKSEPEILLSGVIIHCTMVMNEKSTSCVVGTVVPTVMKMLVDLVDGKVLGILLLGLQLRSCGRLLTGKKATGNRQDKEDATNQTGRKRPKGT